MTDLLLTMLVSALSASVAGIVYLRWRVRSERERGGPPDRYEIGGETYFPVKVTLPVMERLVEAQWEPPTSDEPVHPLAMIFGAQNTKEAHLGMLRATYERLALLLTDREGQHPSPDYLGAYLDIGEANRMFNEIMPS